MRQEVCHGSQGLPHRGHRRCRGAGSTGLHCHWTLQLQVGCTAVVCELGMPRGICAKCKVQNTCYTLKCRMQVPTTSTRPQLELLLWHDQLGGRRVLLLLTAPWLTAAHAESVRSMLRFSSKGTEHSIAPTSELQTATHSNSHDPTSVSYYIMQNRLENPYMSFELTCRLSKATVSPCCQQKA